MTARLTIVGLGPGPRHYLTLEAIEAIRSHATVDARHERHPAIGWLRSSEGQEMVGQVTWRLFDGASTDEQVVEALARRLALGENVCYAVPGNPLGGDRLVAALLDRARALGCECRVVAGTSGLEAAMAAVRAADLAFVDSADAPASVTIAGVASAIGVQTISASSLDGQLTQPGFPTPEAPLFVTGLDEGAGRERLVAWLADRYPETHVVYLVRYTANGAEAVRRSRSNMALHEQPDVSALFVAARPILDVTSSLRTLEYVTTRLRAPDGCPWDREQTHDSIKRNLLEETYELLEAIDERDPEKSREELGDMLMQVFLHAEMGREDGVYDLGTVTRGIVEKLIRRHPHVFGDVRVDGVAGVLRNWDAIKKAEGKHERSILAGIPAAMPALAYAQGAQERAGRTGFAWPDASGAWTKLEEELDELKAAQTPDELAWELGDVLFVLAGLANYLDLQAEEVLRAANQRFRARFEALDTLARERGLTLRDQPLGALLEMWRETKQPAV